MGVDPNVGEREIEPRERLGRTPGVLRAGLERWRQIDYQVMLVLGIVAVVLGFTGFRSDGESAAEAAHRTIQLFAIENIPEAPDELELQIARFLAPLVLGYTAVRAFLSLFRAQVGLVRLRLARDHVVIAGLGGRGYTLARALKEQDEPLDVAAIEADEHSKAVAGCRDRGIPVVIGDATDPSVLAQARVGEARSLVTLLGDDGNNLDAAFSALDVMDEDRKSSLGAFVHLDVLSLWRLLAARGIASGGGPQLRLELFNVEAMAARLLLDEHSPFQMPVAPGRPPHVGIVGHDALGESTVLRLAHLWRTARPSDSEVMRISVMGNAAGELCERLTDHNPVLDSLCSLEPHGVDPVWTDSAGWRREVEDVRALSRVYVCVPDDKAGLVAALAMLEATACRVPVVLTVRDDRVGVATMVRQRKFENLVTFGVNNRTLTEGILASGVNEALARSTHEYYVQNERQRADPADPSLATWERLHPALKESNRSFADGIGKKLNEVKLAIVPSPLSDPEAPTVTFTDAQIDRLAPMEHERWMEDLGKQGWARTDGAKDPDRKLHPQLKPWDELTPQDQEKDRNAVRAIPAILAHAGFELVPVEDVGLSERRATPPGIGG